jgi:hypothetical protein
MLILFLKVRVKQKFTFSLDRMLAPRRFRGKRIGWPSAPCFRSTARGEQYALVAVTLAFIRVLRII